ncbi:MAG: hypothetical protein ACXWEL_00595 [Solirubrobacterales bacterium]
MQLRAAIFFALVEAVFALVEAEALAGTASARAAVAAMLTMMIFFLIVGNGSAWRHGRITVLDRIQRTE